MGYNKIGVFVIHEHDHDDRELTVIGVADDIERVQLMIDRYYGKHEELSHRDIGENNIEWNKLLLVGGAGNKEYKVTITLEWFELNEI